MKTQRIQRVSAWLLIGLLLQSMGYASTAIGGEASKVGITPMLGHRVPLDLTFREEDGKEVKLRDLVHTPVILTPVYLHCPNVCSFLLQNLADVLNQMPAEPGRDYVALSVSFDETETPALAREKKKLFLKMIDRPFPGTAWRFLTGDKENIKKLTDAVGFHFKRKGEDFLHPVAIIVLSPEGKITRYLYGSDPLPFDLKMALVEATHGTIGPAISKVVRFCFSFDPKGHKLVFNALKVTGTVTLFFAAVFILFLFSMGKRRPPDRRANHE
jgi:protein SCO1/2